MDILNEFQQLIQVPYFKDLVSFQGLSRPRITEKQILQLSRELRRPDNSNAMTIHNWRLRQFRQRELHWLDVIDRVRFRVCPGVQVSTQHGTWIPVDTLPTCVQRSRSPLPMLSWSWWTGLPPCQSVHIRKTGISLRRSYILELAAWQSQER